MYWFGFKEDDPAFDPNALARVEIKEVRSGEDEPKDPEDPEVESPLEPVSENPEELEELEDEIGAHAKLMVLGTPG